MSSGQLVLTDQHIPGIPDLSHIQLNEYTVTRLMLVSCYKGQHEFELEGMVITALNGAEASAVADIYQASRRSKVCHC